MQLPNSLNSNKLLVKIKSVFILEIRSNWKFNCSNKNPEIDTEQEFYIYHNK